MMMLSDMRRVVFPIMVVAAIALSSTACRNEQIPDTPQESVHRITVQASHADTRTAVVADGLGGYEPTWMEGDWIHLFEFFEGGVYRGESEELGSTQASVTSFDVDFEEEAPQGPIQYVGAYSPNVDIASVNDEYLGDSWAQAWGNNSQVPNWWLLGNIPENQRPRLESFDPEADVMFSQMIESQTRPESLNLAFARVGSIAKITLKDLPAGERVLWGNLTVGPSWKPWGDLVYDYNKGKIAILPPESDGHDTDGILSDEMINFHFDRDVVPIVGNDGKAVIWMRVLSGELSDHFSVTVYTEDSSGQEHEYVKEVDLVSRGRSIVFEEGGLTEFTVSMEAVDPGTPTGPNIHDYITFSEETLRYFPELASDHPVIRIPRKEYNYYNNINFEWYPFKFSSKYYFADVYYLASFVDDNDPDYSWLNVEYNDAWGDCIYPNTMSDELRSGHIHFVSDDADQNRYPPFDVPVEEYYIPQVTMDDKPILAGGTVFMYPGQEATITVEIPKWMTVKSCEPALYENYEEAVSLSEVLSNPEEVGDYIHYSFTVNALKEGMCRFNFLSFLWNPHMTNLPGGRDSMSYGFETYIHVKTVQIFDQDGRNLTGAGLYLHPGDQIVLEPRVFGLTGIRTMRWSMDSDWWCIDEEESIWEFHPHSSPNFDYEYSTESPYRLTLTVKEDASGDDMVSLEVWLNDDSEDDPSYYGYVDIYIISQDDD